MEKVLLVDDDENILNAYKRNLRTSFQIYTAISPKEALQILKENEGIAVVISDYNMPEVNGIRFLNKVKEVWPDTVRILLTGNAELNMAIKAVNEGNIFRFLTKPCEQEILGSTIKQSIEQYKLITAEKELLGSTLRGSLQILIDILAMISSNIFSKSILIRNLAKKLLNRMHTPDNWEIDISCLLSQIGCVGIPKEIIEKRQTGTTLTNEEEELFVSQAQIGNDLLKKIPRLENIATAISMQYKTVNEIALLRTHFVTSPANDRIIFISSLLKLLNDYFYFLDKEANTKSALELLIKNRNAYNETQLNALKAELQESIESV
jgi:response regulator RpfG family c-di-GMP phosphodiesterase